MVAGSDRCKEMQRRRMACTVFFAAAIHNFCFGEVDGELALFTEAGQCIQLSLEAFWASGHQNEVIGIQQ